MLMENGKYEEYEDAVKRQKKNMPNWARTLAKVFSRQIANYGNFSHIWFKLLARICIRVRGWPCVGCRDIHSTASDGHGAYYI